MATIKYAINSGEKHFEVTVGAGSAVTKQAELTVEDVLTKQERVLAIQALLEHAIRQALDS